MTEAGKQVERVDIDLSSEAREYLAAKNKQELVIRLKEVGGG